MGPDGLVPAFRRPATPRWMPYRRCPALLLLLLLLLLIQRHHSYHVPRPPLPHVVPGPRPLVAWAATSSSSGWHPGATDVDEERDDSDGLGEAAIEAQIARSLQAARRFNASDADAAAALQAGSETFRREVQLLRRLAASDDALPDLLELWRIDREPYAAPHPAADGAEAGVISPRPSWWQRWRLRFGAPRRRRAAEDAAFAAVAESERALLRIVQRHPRWAEPRLRLAEWYGRRRRTAEALAQCLAALELRPWHVAAPDLLVRLALQRRDLGMALAWARLRLPPLSAVAAVNATAGDLGEATTGDPANGDALSRRDRKRLRRRRAWVERAISQAMEQLDVMEAERETSLMRTGNFIIPSETWSER